MTYLGVQIPKDLIRLTSIDYDPLLSNIRKHLARWGLMLVFLSSLSLTRNTL